jgi:hypothetical protein
MKNLSLTIVTLLTMFSTIQAQDFKSAAGIRLGFPFGVDFKHFLNENDAIDVCAGLGGLGPGGGVSILGQYQRHGDINFEDIQNFQWYAGVGGTVGFWRYLGLNGNYFGAHVVVGLSYTLEDLPFNVSLDVAPGFYVGSGRYYNTFSIGSYGALTARYILGGDLDL